jgi:hypothetical protein
MKRVGQRLKISQLPPYQLLVRDTMRLIRLRPLPPLEILDVPLVVPLRERDLGSCWGLATGFFRGEFD